MIRNTQPGDQLVTTFNVLKERKLKAPDPNFKQKIEDSFQYNGAFIELGGTLVTVEHGYVEVHLPFSKKTAQQHGFFHGGIVTTVADTCSGFAGYSVCDVDEECLSAEFKVNFLAPARGDLLIGRGRIIKDGRTLIIAEATISVVRDGQEHECALMLHTLIRTKHVKTGQVNDQKGK